MTLENLPNSIPVLTRTYKAYCTSCHELTFVNNRRRHGALCSLCKNKIQKKISSRIIFKKFRSYRKYKKYNEIISLTLCLQKNNFQYDPSIITKNVINFI